MRVVLLALCVRAALPNCRAPRDPVPGLVTPCTFAVDCQWCERNHASLDFLCCEANKWIGPHLTNPLLFYLMWNNVPWTVAVVLAYELMEIVVLTALGDFDVIFAEKSDAETLAGALIGDVLIQGGLGLLIGYALRVIFVVPTLVSSTERARGYNEHTRRFIYIAAYGAALLAYVLPGFVSDDPSVWRYGLAINTLLELGFVGFVFPVAMASDDVDERMIWRQLDGTQFEGARKAGFFALWGTTIVLAHVPHWPGTAHQPLFGVANEWYLQWLFVGPYAALLVLVAFAVAAVRRDGYTASMLAGSVFAASALIMLLVSGVVASNALVYTAVPLIFAAAGAFLIGALVTWRRVRIPGSRTTTLAAAAVTRRAAVAVFDKKIQ